MAITKVTTEVITGGAVTTPKIADNAITAAKIPDGTIATGHIADNAVTAAKIPDNVLTATMLPDNVILATHIPNATNLTLGTVTAALTGNASGSAATLATARTIAMTGDVAWTSASFDGSGNVTAASTIQTDAVDIAMLSATGTASGTTFLCGDNTWKVAGGSDTPWSVVHNFADYYYDMEVQTKPADPAADHGRFYVKEIDSSNDGVFCLIRKNGAFEETQIV